MAVNLKFARCKSRKRLKQVNSMPFSVCEKEDIRSINLDTFFLPIQSEINEGLSVTSIIVICYIIYICVAPLGPHQIVNVHLNSIWYFKYIVSMLPLCTQYCIYFEFMQLLITKFSSYIHICTSPHFFFYAFISNQRSAAFNSKVYFAINPFTNQL